MGKISRCRRAGDRICGRRTLIGLSLFCAVFLSGCFKPDVLGVRSGTLELNPRLRYDTEASLGMNDARFFADGSCPDGDGPEARLRECHFVSQLRGSRVSEADRLHLSRLRRAGYFWVEADSSPVLSYELIARQLVVTQGGNVLAGPVDIGTCKYFPVADPESRRPVRGLEDATVPRAREFASTIDVLVQRCESQPVGAISEGLAEQGGNCSLTNVLSLVGDNAAPNARACAIDLPLGMLPGSSLSRDASHSLVLRPANGAGMVVDWPEVMLKPLGLLPHFKSVPVGGTRTISRQLENTLETIENADGSTTRRYAWRVQSGGQEWSENFSPNVVVQRVRVRKGDLDDPDRSYLPVEALRAGEANCQVRDDSNGYTVFDIPVCDLSGEYRVTPAYRYSNLQQAPVDDLDRLNWRVSLRDPPVALAESDRLYIEFDLTALPGTGTTGSGLLGEPPGRNFGSIRTGATTNSRQAFVLRNDGPVSVRVDSVTLAGRDAGEFGTVTLRRRASAGAATPPAGVVSTPFVFRAGSSLEVLVSPAFQHIGDKQAEILVNHRDVRGVRQPLRFPVSARAIAPDIAALPQIVGFPQPPLANGYAQASRSALLVNNGPLPLRRSSLALGGADASQFRLLSPLATQTAVTVAPGASETYRIGYFPRAAGVHDAELRIDTDEGRLVIQLHGVCNRGCRQPPVVSPVDGPVVPVVPVPRTTRVR